MKTFKLVAIMLAVISFAESQTIYYVKTSGDDLMAGTSWGTALATVQKALSMATSGSQIWVAAGTYKPTATTDRTISFVLKNGVGLYGGFAGTESILEDRNWQTNVTTLSGDIDGDATLAGNSYHIVTGSSADGTAVLDGFVITGGNANGSSGNDTGGGVYLLFSSPTLSNLVVSSNYATAKGGGMENILGSPAMVNISFVSNQCANWGGGFDNELNCNPVLTNCSFIGNTAYNGGGMYNSQNSLPVMTNVIFRNDTASNIGGGLYNTDQGISMENILFQGNDAGLLGGGIYNVNGNSTFTNLTVTGNVAHAGGGMFITGTSTATVRNSIFWNDNVNTGGAEIHNTSSGTVTVTYSILKGGIAAGGGNALTDGGSNIDSDPLFVDPGTNNLGLMQTSPAIDAGNNAVVIATTDLAGNPRISHGNVDMGAYEYQGAPVPVQLVSFTAKANRSNAVLQWRTATEVNNYGFEIERRAVMNQAIGNNWKTIGFVEGHGTTSIPHEYSFTDGNLSSGRYAYRIKQLDNDGTFSYTTAAEVEVGLAPKEFTLSQNYPNPFNPTTDIQFTVPNDGKVVLKVYNELGQEVAELFNGDVVAGRIHQVKFDAMALPSGLYFARIVFDGDRRLVRKMLLLK